VESCLMKCKYREQGCPEVLKGGELGAHLKVCDYRWGNPIRSLTNMSKKYTKKCESGSTNHALFDECRHLRCYLCRGSWIAYGDYWNHMTGVHGINGINYPRSDVIFNLDCSPIPRESKSRIISLHHLSLLWFISWFNWFLFPCL